MRMGLALKSGPRFLGSPPGKGLGFLATSPPSPSTCAPQGYKKFWAGLQGLTISFYSSNRDFQPLEKLDLRTFVKLTDEAPRAGSRDPGIHFSLVLRDQEIKFKVGHLEGLVLPYFPAPLTHTNMESSGLLCRVVGGAARPRCFLKVSRLEAQLLLERYPECGNLLLRPSGDGKDGVSVTTRQTLNGYCTHACVPCSSHVSTPHSTHLLEAGSTCTHTCRALSILDHDNSKRHGPARASRAAWGQAHRCSRRLRTSPAPPADGSKSLPPVASSQDRLPPLPPLPPLLSQDDNYVTPIADAPAADYVNQDGANQDGAWGRVLLGGGPPPLGLGDVTAELQEKLQKRRALEQ
uniref:SH2 domain-containing protein n=1 Tax=Spermophilus dauricus TaxID=99837 RepID=A0A8C9UNI0_SPEDA